MIRKEFIFIITIFFSGFISAQNADEIINKNIEKTGGLIEWKKLNSVKLKGEAILGVNESYPVEIYQKRPNLSKTIMTIERKKYVIEGYDGSNGYQFNFTTGKLEKIPNYTPDNFEMDLIDYTSKGWKAQYIGKETINGKNCFKVVLTKNTNKTTYYFDTVTYYLIREINSGEIIDYSNYKQNGKLWFAYSIDNQSNNKDSDFSIRVNSIEINTIINNNDFKF